MPDTMLAETVTISVDADTRIDAYLARSLASGPTGSVVVIHHMPGHDAATKEITRRFAALGYNALCPNLYARQAPGASPDDAAAAARAQGGKPDDELVADVVGSIAHLRGLNNTNGRVGTIGFCSGGRQSFLAATSLQLDAAVDCYGAFVTGTPPREFPVAVTPIGDRTPQLSCPLLGLFGNDDAYPSPEHVDELEGLLKQAGKDYEFHRYDDAAHAFLAVDRPSYRPEQAMDAWGKIAAFFGRHLT